MNGINLFGVGGVIAALIGLFLYGRSVGKQSQKKNIIKAKTEAQKANIQKELTKTVAQSVVDAAKEQSDAQARYEANIKAINDARRVGDTDALSRIASETAKKALEMTQGDNK